MRPYIAITDFTDFSEVQKMKEIFNYHLPSGSKRLLSVGVMMSYKTLHGYPTRWQDAFPKKEKIRHIFFSDAVLNTLHFACYDPYPDIWKSISCAIGYGGDGIHALQLDMIWPEPNDIAMGVHTSRASIEVILQINKHALDEVHNNPDELIEKLYEYNGVIHRILLDKSMGTGKCLDARYMLPYIRAIRSNHPQLEIGVAGGLGPKTITLLKPIISEFSDISIDAQARLRPSHSALDPINWEMAGKYLIEAIKLLA